MKKKKKVKFALNATAGAATKAAASYVAGPVGGVISTALHSVVSGVIGDHLEAASRRYANEVTRELAEAGIDPEALLEDPKSKRIIFAHFRRAMDSFHPDAEGAIARLAAFCVREGDVTRVTRRMGRFLAELTGDDIIPLRSLLDALPTNKVGTIFLGRGPEHTFVVAWNHGNERQRLDVAYNDAAALIELLVRFSLVKDSSSPTEMAESSADFYLRADFGELSILRDLFAEAWGLRLKNK